MEKYFKHLNICNKMQDWLEADQAMADTPSEFRDESFFIAISEMEEKKRTCTCGMEECLKTLHSMGLTSSIK